MIKPPVDDSIETAHCRNNNQWCAQVYHHWHPPNTGHARKAIPEWLLHVPAPLLTKALRSRKFAHATRRGDNRFPSWKIVYTPVIVSDMVRIWLSIEFHMNIMNWVSYL
jgi:hypothetical protein